MRAVGGGAGDVGEDGRVRGPAARRSPAPPRGGTGAVFPGAAPRAAGPQGSGRTGGHRKRRCGRYRKQHGPTIGGIRLSRYVGSGGVRADARQTSRAGPCPTATGTGAAPPTRRRTRRRGHARRGTAGADRPEPGRCGDHAVPADGRPLQPGGGAHAAVPEGGRTLGTPQVDAPPRCARRRPAVRRRPRVRGRAAGTRPRDREPREGPLPGGDGGAASWPRPGPVDAPPGRPRPSTGPPEGGRRSPVADPRPGSSPLPLPGMRRTTGTPTAAEVGRSPGLRREEYGGNPPWDDAEDRGVCP